MQSLLTGLMHGELPMWAQQRDLHKKVWGYECWALQRARVWEGTGAGPTTGLAQKVRGYECSALQKGSCMGRYRCRSNDGTCTKSMGHECQDSRKKDGVQIQGPAKGLVHRYGCGSNDGTCTKGTSAGVRMQGHVKGLVYGKVRVRVPQRD